MPSLLSPNAGNPPSSRSYTPLADEVNPPFGNHAPTVTRNGTVVYGKRSSSYSESDTPEELPGPSLVRTPSDRSSRIEYTNYQVNRGTGVQMQGEEEQPEGDEDIGELGRSRTVRASSYKGKERAWDEEMGDRVEFVRDSYPPVNEIEDEEKRIQDNLAKIAARDMARRRAARLSKAMPTSPTAQSRPSSSSESTTTSYLRRPFSLISTLSSPTTETSKRNSMMGMMGGWIGGTQQKDELPLSSSRTGYNNPYDPPPRAVSPNSQTMSSSRPNSYSGPFADPVSTQPNQPTHTRYASYASSSSPTEHPDNLKYGYVGAQWRGGAAMNEQQQEGSQGDGHNGKQRGNTGERWWHALCAWGSDLDGGHDINGGGGNQAGRTNPFE